MNEGRELVAELQFVSIECIPPVTIINKSFTALGPGVFVGGYNFCNTGESRGDCRNFLAQIDQQITIPGRCGLTTDRDRCRSVSRRSAENFVGNETPVPECPQQVIDLLHRLTIRGVNVDGIVETIGFLGKAAGKSLPGLFTRATDYIEINL